jgi:hypothetical protein
LGLSFDYISFCKEDPIPDGSIKYTAFALLFTTMIVYRDGVHESLHSALLLSAVFGSLTLGWIWKVSPEMFVFGLLPWATLPAFLISRVHDRYFTNFESDHSRRWNPELHEKPSLSFT